LNPKELPISTAKIFGFKGLSRYRLFARWEGIGNGCCKPRKFKVLQMAQFAAGQLKNRFLQNL
jgi:hypothetical protein